MNHLELEIILSLNFSQFRAPNPIESNFLRPRKYDVKQMREGSLTDFPSLTTKGKEN
jgi:hypothetical protein